MKVDKRFPLHVAITLVAGLVLGFGLMKLTGNDSPDIMRAVVVGAVLSTLNVMSGFFAIEYTLDKSYTTFLKAVLGGMGVRMGVMLGIIALLIKFGGLHIVGLVVSVLSFYVVYLALEIFYIQKRLSHKNLS
jgi:hypothetical protein